MRLVYLRQTHSQSTCGISCRLYIVATAAMRRKVAALPFVLWIGLCPSRFKYHPQLSLLAASDGTSDWATSVRSFTPRARRSTLRRRGNASSAPAAELIVFHLALSAGKAGALGAAQLRAWLTALREIDSAAELDRISEEKLRLVVASAHGAAALRFVAAKPHVVWIQKPTQMRVKNAYATVASLRLTCHTKLSTTDRPMLTRS